MVKYHYFMFNWLIGYFFYVFFLFMQLQNYGNDINVSKQTLRLNSMAEYVPQLTEYQTDYNFFLEIYMRHLFSVMTTQYF